MQQAAISHSDLVGCTIATNSTGGSWVVRIHHVEYLRPAFAGDEIAILTSIS
jgi:acyl-CoA thioester hydrolase